MSYLARREVAKVILKDFVSGRPFMFIPYGQTWTNEHTGDTAYAKGGQGNPIMASFNGNRATQLKLTSQVFDYNLIAFLAGTEVETGSKNIFKREVLTSAGSGTVTIELTETPVGGVFVFPLESDCVEAELETVTVETKTVTITGGVAATKYVAYYFTATVAGEYESVTFNTAKFPVSCKISGESLVKASKGNINKVEHFECYNAQAQAGFTIEMNNDGDPASIEVTFDLMPDEDGNTITYTRRI